MMVGKPFFKSKTFWINVIGFMAILTGSEEYVNADTQVAILTIVNLVLRAVTKEPINWGDEN